MQGRRKGGATLRTPSWRVASLLIVVPFYVVCWSLSQRTLPVFAILGITEVCIPGPGVQRTLPVFAILGITEVCIPGPDVRRHYVNWFLHLLSDASGYECAAEACFVDVFSSMVREAFGAGLGDCVLLRFWALGSVEIAEAVTDEVTAADEVDCSGSVITTGSAASGALDELVSLFALRVSGAENDCVGSTSLLCATSGLLDGFSPIISRVPLALSSEDLECSESLSLSDSGSLFGAASSMMDAAANDDDIGCIGGRRWGLSATGDRTNGDYASSWLWDTTGLTFVGLIINRVMGR